MDTNSLGSQLGVEVLKILVPIVGTAVGSLLSYLLYQLTGLIKNQKLQEEARKAVAFAEQKLVNNDEKLAYVKNFLKANAGKYLSDQDIDHLVEAAVNALPPTHPDGQQSN